MRKQDYTTLAQIFRNDLASLRVQRLKQMEAASNGEFPSAFDAVKALETRINHITLIAKTCALALSVDEKAFLKECSIWTT